MLRDLREDFRPRRLLLGLAAGLVVGAVVVIVAISFAALVFAGDLARFTAIGVGLSLFGAAALAIVVALSSSYRGMVATPQDSTAAVLALIAASTAAAMPAGAGDRQTLLTVVAAIGLTTALTGVFFFLLGWFRLGGLVRYLPYPVVGGFLAGTGWLLVRGSIGVMADVPLAPDTLGTLLTPDVALRWAPGVAFAVALLLVLRRVEHLLVLPLALVGAIAAFYLLLVATGTSLAEARDLGLLLGPFPDSGLWSPLMLAAATEADWPSVFHQLGSMAPVLVVGVVALLLNATGLELALRRDVDLDRELRIGGVANVLCGALGGLPGFQTLSLSALGHRMSPDSRFVGLFSGMLCGATLMAGDAVLGLLPKAALGGLLCFLGLVFLVEWVFDARATMSRTDSVIVLVILAVIATVGFLESVGIGIGIAVIFFAVNYSRVDVIRYVLDGSTQRSNVDRSAEQQAVLDERGDALLIVRLQGFLFFGTANALLERLRARLDDRDRPALAWVLIDFQLVTGLDSSAVLSFVKLGQLAEARGFGIGLSELGADVEQQLRRGGFLGGSGAPETFDDTDRGIQWCEDRLLQDAGVALEIAAVPIEERLARFFRGRAEVDELLEFFRRIEAEPGTALMRRGEPPDSGLFVVESGQVSVQLEIEGRTVRLHTMGPGSVIGEIELYTGAPREATIVTEAPAVLWQISLESLQLMQEADPALAEQFHRVVAAIMARRLARNHEVLRAVMA